MRINKDKCPHPEAKWGKWRRSLTIGRQFRWKRCTRCGKILDSQQRQKP